MVIIISIIVAILLLVIVVKLLRWSIRLVAVPVVIIFALVMTSYVFVPSVNILNSPVYIYKYQKAVNQNYSIAYKELVTSGNIDRFRAQLNTINNSVDLLGKSAEKLPILGNKYVTLSEHLVTVNEELQYTNLKDTERILKEECLNVT